MKRTDGMSRAKRTHAHWSPEEEEELIRLVQTGVPENEWGDFIKRGAGAMKIRYALLKKTNQLGGRVPESPVPADILPPKKKTRRVFSRTVITVTQGGHLREVTILLPYISLLATPHTGDKRMYEEALY